MESQQLQQPQEESLVKTAAAFLTNNKVKNASLKQKIQFLKGKGLSDDQIIAAFASIGITITMNDIKGCLASSPLIPATLSRNLSHTNSAPIRQPSPTTTYTAYPPSITHQHSNEPSPPSWDWRNVVIGIGGAALATAGAVKAWNAYSPYEFRRKATGSATELASPQAPSIPQPLPSLPSFPALPSLPSPKENAPPESSSAEVETLKKEISELKTTLEAEKKSKAEILIRIPKHKSEINSLTHQKNRLEEKVAELENKIKEMMGPQSEKEGAEEEGEAKDASTPVISPAEEPVPSFFVPENKENCPSIEKAEREEAPEAHSSTANGSGTVGSNEELMDDEVI